MSGLSHTFRIRYRFGELNSLAHTPSDAILVQSQDAAPFSQGMAVAVVLVLAGIVPVIALPLAIGPAAIFLAVVAIVVYAIEGRSFWANSHIVKKCLKRMAPIVGHCNPSSAIAVEKPRVWVCATLNHCHPGAVCRGLCHSMLANGCDVEASARPVPTRPKVSSACDAGLAAIAFTFPSKSYTHLWCWSNYQQTTKALSG